MRIGVTGHRTLQRTETWEWVRREITAILRGMKSPLTGISSLAIGADQVFAEMILDLGGALEVVLPFEDYERTFPNHADLDRFRRLRAAASRVETLAPSADAEHAYLLAGERIVRLSDRMIAVWDGMPARGVGGTAMIVQVARAAGVPVTQLNPVNATVQTVEVP